jgi:hypothetical protein
MAFIIDDIVKGIAAKKAGKEQKRAGEEQSKAQFESDTKGFENAEDQRQASARALLSGLGSLFGGKYAGLAQGSEPYLTNRRRNTAFKQAVVDPSKGAMWGAAGNALTSAGDIGTKILGGIEARKILGGDASQPTTLRPSGTAGGFDLSGGAFSDPDRWRLK